MKLTVLVDNHAKGKLQAEWGLSMLLETEQGKTLFDFGSSDMYLKNAEQMGLDLKDVKRCVLSHGHWDHGSGLVHWENGGELICHPEVFTERYRKSKVLGLPCTEDEVYAKMSIRMSREPLEIEKGVFFLGEIPRRTDFESKYTPFTKADGSEDFVTDDTGLAMVTDNGLTVLSGCAHSGICNIVEHAKDVTGVSKIHALLGGFHLKGNGERTQRTIAYLKDINPDFISTSHCTDFEALTAFYEAFGSIPFGVGDVIEF
jgi:7,8-dihydropterin-6-yl-methyl-4-(beta-D-ribofuranosyl)aminobenzene 5'-phosphate synthase